jgi:hypothetical protein
MEYNRIIYPERAEYLTEATYESYKIFLDHWNDLSLLLKSNFEEALLRRVSKTLIIYGEQSSGKTLLARKLAAGFSETEANIRKNALDHDPNNLWHRMSSGFAKEKRLIADNTNKSALLHIEDDHSWVEKVKKFCGANSSRTCLIIADNCERDYFVRGLLELTSEQFLQIGRTDALVSAAAQKFVALCREELRGAVLVMFTNDDFFAKKFKEEVNKQHRGLVQTTDMPIPSPRDKEAVVRVNTNRLNRFSYWYCLDRAGVNEKKNVLRAIKESKGYKDVFEAVDVAIQNATPSRIGRPPKKCLLTLFSFTNNDDIDGLMESLDLGEFERNVIQNSFLDVVTFKENWTDSFDLGDKRRAALLKSEWNFRMVVAGNHFTGLLLSKAHPNETKNLIEQALKYHGPGTQNMTLEAFRAQFAESLKVCSDISTDTLGDFWAAGQSRAQQYEGALKELFQNYNTNNKGFLTYRPDLVLESYRTCELSLSENEEDASINQAIRREAIACEFTSLKDFNLAAIQTYMNRKITNYVEILQEQ